MNNYIVIVRTITNYEEIETRANTAKSAINYVRHQVAADGGHWFEEQGALTWVYLHAITSISAEEA